MFDTGKPVRNYGAAAPGRRFRPPAPALWIAVAVCAAWCGDLVTLTPEKVKELVTTQNAMIKASELGIRAQERARMSAFTAFLPTVNGTAGATHLVTQPKFEFEAGGGFDMASIVDTGTFPPTPVPPYDLGDLALLNQLSSMFDFGDLAMSPTNIYSLGLTVAQPLFTGGKILNAYRIQKHSTEAKRLTHERTKDEMAFAALSLYWGYVGSLKGLEATAETCRWFEKLVGDQEKMFRSGLIIDLDVLNSKIQLSNFKLLEMKMQDMIRTVGGQLLLFLGLPSDAVIEVDTASLRSEVTVNLQPGADSVAHWLAVRDDVRAMQCQLDMMRCLEKIQKAAYAPTVAGFANFAYSNQYSISDETKFDNTSAFGVSLNWMLFDWGRGVREAQKINYQAEALQLQIENMGEQVRLKKYELARKVAQSAKARAIAREDAAVAAKALDIARIRYDAQTITNTELLTARNQLTSKNVAYTQACINVKLALEEYRLAPLSSGRPLAAGSIDADDAAAGGSSAPEASNAGAPAAAAGSPLGSGGGMQGR
ncbi:MAG: TolC family protein [Chitinispirillaceae bacterium]|nr:TolC family protein [Chitinispirillaceae bacterium]